MISITKKTIKPRNIFFCCVLVVFISTAASFFYSARPAFASRSYNPARSCLSNLKTIEGAIELYIMENNSAVNSTDDLVKNGYLKVKPICYAKKGSTDTYIFEKPVTSSNFNQFFKIVKCLNHGHYLTDKNIFEKEIDAANEYRIERRKFFGTIAGVLSLLILWQSIILWRRSSC